VLNPIPDAAPLTAAVAFGLDAASATN